ncbi:MAG: prepilin-type N-terminal cleavage/methylation domain-containing protein [Gemmatimonadetes bacterium]|nr:prepilin-type N-terminal cleavage/methylation domain-containing protein [Gemmatimonadota bacterium]
MKTPRDGFTLIEIMIAMSILLVVMLTLMTMTGRTVHTTTLSEREQAALQLVTDRTDEVRTNPSYANLDSLYAGTESSFATLAGFTRVTTIVRTTSGGHDYKKVTVTVTGPGVTTPVSRTVTVAAP